MKKHLLAFMLVATTLCTNAQLYLNELYVRPNDGHDEYFELYNASFSTVNANCYTLVTYFETGTTNGFYVVDIPNLNVAAGGFLVGATTKPYVDFQGDQAEADFGWNDPGVVNRYVYRNGALVKDNTGAPFTDIFLKSGKRSNNDNQEDGVGAGVYATFLFNGNTLVDAFLGDHQSIEVPKYITDLGTLMHASTGDACGNLTYNFANINNEDDALFGFVRPAAGTDNGYLRCGNGPCPDNMNWYKANNPKDHTPGMPNNTVGCGNNGQGVGQVDVAVTIAAGCLDANTFAYTIIGDQASSFPIKVSVYFDANGNGTYEAGVDQLRGTANFNYTLGAGQQLIVRNPAEEDFLILTDAPGICNDRVQAVQCPPAIILPVSLKAFTAKRNRTEVSLRWETASEQNNRGFYIQRKIGPNNWETVGFVKSLAADGNSDAVLTYSYSDLNATRGITQYRLLQEDMNGKTKYSDIRSVQGEGAASKLVIYPNPSADGVVNIMFDEAGSSRSVYVSDINGRIINQWRNITGNTLKITSLLPGMYTLRVIDNASGEQTTEKIIINKR